MDGNANRGAARWFAAGAMAIALASMMMLAIGLASSPAAVSAGPLPVPPDLETPTEPPATSTQEVVTETPEPTNTQPASTNTPVPTNTAVPTNTSVPTATATTQALVAQVAAATAPPAVVVRALPATGTGGSSDVTDMMLLVLGLVGLTFSIGLGALSWKYSRS